MGQSTEVDAGSANAAAAEIAEIVAERLVHALTASVTTLHVSLAEELTSVVRDALATQPQQQQRQQQQQPQQQHGAPRRGSHHTIASRDAWGLPAVDGAKCTDVRPTLIAAGTGSFEEGSSTSIELVTGSTGLESDYCRCGVRRVHPEGSASMPGGFGLQQKRHSLSSRGRLSQPRPFQSLRSLTSSLDGSLLTEAFSKPPSESGCLSPRQSVDSKANTPIDITQVVSGILPNQTRGSLGDLRHDRELELTRDFHRQISDQSSTQSPTPTRPLHWWSRCARGFAPVTFLLRLCGAIPWRPCRGEGLRNRLRSCCRWYQWTVLFVATVLLANCLYVTVRSRVKDFDGSNCKGPDCAHLGHLSDVALVLGSTVILFSLSVCGFDTHLNETLGMIRMYAGRRDFYHAVLSSSQWDFLAGLLLWAIAAAERIRGLGALLVNLEVGLGMWEALHMLAFIFSSFVLLALTNCVVFVCRGLIAMVDTYGCEVVGDRDLSEAVRNWNVVQAVLRKASQGIEHCFFALQTTVFATVLLGITDAQQSMGKGRQGPGLYGEGRLVTLVPAALLVLSLLRIFYASVVTSKCARVPSLINSLSFGSDFDVERQYVVEYITNSAAGFYVYDVRLTSSLSLKAGYVCAALAFSLATMIFTTH